MPATIGPSTAIDLPKLGVKGVPAKVDTGADSSSIWASNIKEKNGRLSFTLFAPGSPFYSGKEVITSAYTISSVRNSFGHTEFRYKVNLQTIIEGKSVRVNFTLANRSENNFPVLIGRRTLHNRFLVDVSKTGKKQFHILVMKPKLPKKGGGFENFFAELAAQNDSIIISFASYKELKFLFNGKKTSVLIERLDRDAADFDLVHFLVVGDYKDQASALAQYLQSKGVRHVDRSAADYYQSLHKLHQTLLFTRAGVRVPKTVYMSKDELAGSYDDLKEFLGLPFVVKGIHGKLGRDNYLIKNRGQFDRLWPAIDDDLIVQKFISNDGDYRIIIFGRQIKLIIKRPATRGTHLNNVSQTGKAELVNESELPASVRRMAVKAAHALNVDISGVDMVQDKETGLWYCLEVNENPQIASGVFTDKKQKLLADYWKKKLLNI